MVKKAFAFDFDGTLVDSNELEKVTMVETIQRYQDPSFRPDAIYRYFGPTEEGILRRVIAPERIPEALAFFLSYYEKRQEDLLIVLPGMEEILALLKETQKKVFLLTGRSRETLLLSLSRLSFSSSFQRLYTGSLTGVNKAESMRRLMQENGLAPEEVLYIGDTLEDIRSMKECGVDLLSAGYAHSESYVQELERNNPGRTCRSVQELQDKIKGLL